jgi:hypothetical protein
MRITCTTCGLSYRSDSPPGTGATGICARCGAPRQLGEAAAARSVVPAVLHVEKRHAPLGRGPLIDVEPAGFGAHRRSRQEKAGPARRSAGRLWARAAVAASALIVAVFLGGSLFAREAMVRQAPELAPLYALAGMDVNLRGIEISGLRTARDRDGSMAVLVVDGTLENVGPRPRPVPRLRFGLQAADGREVYAWTMEPGQPMLDPGERVAFASRLPSPPDTASAVHVRFTDRPGP